MGAWSEDRREIDVTFKIFKSKRKEQKEKETAKTTLVRNGTLKALYKPVLPLQHV
jgi:hypothetical protein